MKKILYILVFVCTLSFLTTVNAEKYSCDMYTLSECQEGRRDDYKNTCTVKNGVCTIKTKYVNCTEPGDAGCDCSAFSLDFCTKAFNSRGKACDVVNGKCAVAPEGSARYNEGTNTPGTPGTGHARRNNYNSYDNYDTRRDVTCGNGLVFNRAIANVAHYMVLVFQIFGPVMLVIFGMIDLFKGIVAGKDDEIKKGQSVFIKRLTTALLMFFVITIIRVLLSFLATDNITDCFKCFVNGADVCEQEEEDQELCDENDEDCKDGGEETEWTIERNI